jgi:PPK2 family polyphosphate:nucleotide phosphotransferase
MKLTKIIKRFRVYKPDNFRLADVDPADTCGLDIEKAEAKALLADGIERLSKLQEKLYAQNQWAVLAVFQAMDAAGKDGAIKHVMSGVNPQGCQVHAFKQPSSEELDHDFLWRIAKALPERGRIGIFNRSHYEDVLVARVHPEVLARQRLPKTLLSKDIWDERFKSIREFERHLARNGVLVLKFFLHISKEEQRKRFLARLDEPAKRWKFEMGDVAERKLWDKYMHVYEDAIRHTSRTEAPWFVVPANNKGFARLVIAEAMVEAMEGLKLEFPKVEGPALKELAKVRRALLAEAPKGRAT